MTFYRNILIAINLMMLAHCASTQGKIPDPPPYRSVSIDRFVSSRVGLRMRSHHDIKASVVSILALNTKLKCTQETNFPDKIDSKIAPWLYCSSGKYAGWIFRGYTDEELSIEVRKNNLIQSLGNDTAIIEVILLKSGLFRVKFLNILSRDNNQQEFFGRWQLDKDRLKLTFEGENTGENALFFLSKGKPITDLGPPVTHVKDRVYMIELTEPTIFIWGVRCAVKKVDT